MIYNNTINNEFKNTISEIEHFFIIIFLIFSKNFSILTMQTHIFYLQLSIQQIYQLIILTYAFTHTILIFVWYFSWKLSSL